MKKIIITLTDLLIITSIFAQSPEKMSYQAVVRNNSNALVTNQIIGMEINIRQGTPTGIVVYTETQTPSTNANGLVSIEIGGGEGFSTIDWANGPYYIETKTDPTGATNYTITGTSQLLSVPFALYAKTTAGLDGKVDKVTGKGLSTEDYTTADKTKLNGIASGAEVNVNADWNATGEDAQILNKPANIDEDKTDDVTLTGNQTIAGNKTISGSTAFTGTTTVPTPVNATDAATKAYVDVLLNRIENLELLNYGFSDSRDGNHYDVVKIGNQLWMAENLKYLPSVVSPVGGSTTTPYYYVYDYGGTNVADAKATANYATYGVLYNWPAAMAGAASSTANPSGVQGVCPTGWHLPSDAEWSELFDYLGGTSVAGGKLKETGTTHWVSPNAGATNETGFTALPGGNRYFFTGGGAFGFVGYNSDWWSATEYVSEVANFWGVDYNGGDVSSTSDYKELGFSVRCVRD